MPLEYEMLFLDGLEWWYQGQGEEAGVPESGGQTAALGSQEEGFFARVHEGEIADFSWKPYFPSASKGDRAATAEELQVIFGATYTDERN